MGLLQITLMNNTCTHKEKSTHILEILIWKFVIDMMHSHETWQNSTEKPCKPSKRGYPTTFPLKPHKMFKRKGQLILITLWSNGSHTHATTYESTISNNTQTLNYYHKIIGIESCMSSNITRISLNNLTSQ